MYHFENETFFFFLNIEILKRKKNWAFKKKSLGSSMPLVQGIFLNDLRAQRP